MSSNGDRSAYDEYVSEAERALAEELVRMRGMLASECVIEEQLVAQLRESVDRRKKLEKVIDLLEGTDKKPTPKKGQWHVSDQRVEEIWQLMRGQTESAPTAPFRTRSVPTAAARST